MGPSTTPNVWRRASKGGTFYVQLGKRQASLRTKDRRLALRRAAELAQGGDPFRDDDAASVRRVVDDYLEACERGSALRRKVRSSTLRVYNLVLHRFVGWLERRDRTRLEELTTPDVAGYLDDVEGLPATHNTHRSIISAFFSWAIRAELWDRINPIVKTQARSARHDDNYEPERARYFSPEEMTQILDALAERRLDPIWRVVELAVWLCRFTGSRIGEVTALRYEDFLWDASPPLLDAVMPKTKRRKQVELPPELVDRYRDAWRGRTSLVLVPPESWASRPDLVAQRLSERFGRLLKAIGLKARWVSTHTLRHTFASEAILAGVPIDVVSQWLGHRHIQTTHSYYSHLVPRSARQVTRSWWGPAGRGAQNG